MEVQNPEEAGKHGQAQSDEDVSFVQEKKKRGRPKKPDSEKEKDVSQAESADTVLEGNANDGDDSSVQEKRKRGRPRKPESEKKIIIRKFGKRGRPTKPKEEKKTTEVVKKPRGRPLGSKQVNKIKRGRGRPRKVDNLDGSPKKSPLKEKKPLGRPRKLGSIKLNIQKRSLKFANGPKRGLGRPRKSEYKKRGRPKKIQSSNETSSSDDEKCVQPNPEGSSDEETSTRDSSFHSPKSGKEQNSSTPEKGIKRKGSHLSPNITGTPKKRKTSLDENDDDVDIEDTTVIVEPSPLKVRSPRKQKDPENGIGETTKEKKIKKYKASPKSKQK